MKEEKKKDYVRDRGDKTRVKPRIENESKSKRREKAEHRKEKEGAESNQDGAEH